MKKNVVVFILLALFFAYASVEGAEIASQPFSHTDVSPLSEVTPISVENGNIKPVINSAEDNSEPKAYILHIVDQNGSPVPGMTVTFCTDTICFLQQADENGIITFNCEPDIYHVQLLKAPEGYSFDAEFEMYTDRAYVEWLLCIRKD